MTSLFRQFSEIYNLKHTKVGSGRPSTEGATKRLQHSQQLLERFPNEKSVRRIWFTETTFTIDTKINSQKWPCLLSWIKEKASSRKDNYTRTWTCSRIMVSVGVSRTWGTLGAKVNSKYYCEHVLKRGLLPITETTCGRHNWTLQQDGAPSYTARNTINFLQENVNFIEPDKWPPNSPD